MLVIGLAACSPVAPGGADARPVDGADTPPVDASLVDTPLVDAMAPDTPPGLVICHFDLDTFGNGCVFGN